MNTIAGTLKVEIINPDRAVRDRLHAMRNTVAQALNLTMRDLYPVAISMIAGVWSSEGFADSITGKVEPLLRQHWNDALAQRYAYDCERRQRDNEARKKQGKHQLDMPDENSYAPITETWSAATRQAIESRFKGEHLKDLLASRASFPSWHSSAAFYARERSCTLEGPPSAAVLKLPLWPGPKGGVRLRVAVCGDNAEAQWRSLTASPEARAPISARVEALRAELKRAGVTRPKDINADERMKALRKELKGSGIKLGSVGVAYSPAADKWYALISWSGEPCPEVQGTQIAAAHIGTTSFVQIVAADGSEFHVSGEDIIVTRQRFAHRRASLQRSLNTMGTGSKGRGVKRRMLSVTRLEDAESRFVTTKIRQVAHAIISWCLRHNVGLLLWPDMTGSREEFERKTEGEAHEDVKRVVHSFPFYELYQAVERDGKERGVRVEAHSTAYDSQTCPKCGHVSATNLKEMKQRVEVIEHHGRRFERREVVKRFECEACRNTGHRDVIACVNALGRHGHNDAGGKVAKRARAKVKQMVGEVQA